VLHLLLHKGKNIGLSHLKIKLKNLSLPFSLSLKPGIVRIFSGHPDFDISEKILQRTGAFTVTSRSLYAYMKESISYTTDFKTVVHADIKVRLWSEFMLCISSTA